MKPTRKQLIEAAVKDLASDLVYYDRKEDEELPRDSIQLAIINGEITMKDIVDVFANKLNEVLTE